MQSVSLVTDLTCFRPLKALLGMSTNQCANSKNHYTYLKAKLAGYLAMCLLPVVILERCGLATGPANVKQLRYKLPN